MKQHVTVVPSDRFIQVDGIPLWFSFTAPATLHALQWHGTAGEMEWNDDLNHPLTPQDYEADVAPYVTLWETEKARLDALVPPAPTLEDTKAIAYTTIKTAFTAAELDGYVESTLGFRCDATRRSIEDIEGLIDLITAGVVSAPATFRDYDNQYHALTVEQLQTLCLETKSRGTLLYAHKWKLEAAVAEATDISTVQAIDCVHGWPGSPSVRYLTPQIQ